MPTKTTPADVEGTAGTITTRQMRRLHALLHDHGFSTDKAIHDYLSTALGHPIESRANLGTMEAAEVIAELEAAAVPVPRHGSLAAALVAFQAELPTVTKGQTATVPMKSGGQYSYTYADLGAVTAAAIPLLVKHGISFTCRPRGTERGYEAVGVLTHVSGDTAEGSLPLHGNSPQDLGGSLTYARRYLLGAMTGIVTEDDNDAAHTRGAGVSRTREWDGPTTAALLNQIDADASRAGVTYAQATEKFRQQHGIPDLEGLDALDPWLVAPLAEGVRRRAEEVIAEREAAGVSDTPGPGASGEQPPA